MDQDNHYNVVLKNANEIYIGVLSDPLNTIIGLTKVRDKIGLNHLQSNEIGIIQINGDNTQLRLKRVYTIGDETTKLDLLSLETSKLYELINNIYSQYLILVDMVDTNNNPVV